MLNKVRLWVRGYNGKQTRENSHAITRNYNSFYYIRSYYSTIMELVKQDV